MEETVKSCTTCVYGNVLCCNNDIVCAKKGVMSEDSPCRKYEEDLTKRVVRKRRTVKITTD
ncbi:MAG: hypothetical protein J6A69_09710 [Clostridia bacterium]|nr:hypothetical protein [Clostridia bacterium]